jgi:hypothetical protein
MASPAATRRGAGASAGAGSASLRTPSAPATAAGFAAFRATHSATMDASTLATSSNTGPTGRAIGPSERDSMAGQGVGWSVGSARFFSASQPMR